jgi:hypothetical protein
VDRCSIGEFAAVQPLPASANDASGGLLGALTGMMNEVVPAGTAPAALRMSGQFAGPGGLKLDFDVATVTLDCAQAHVRQAYTVQNTAGGIVIGVQNGQSPFTLAIGPDGALNGTGATQVDGRLLVAMTSGSPQFAPTSAHCTVGRLAPAP